jgi:hypothetical protein
MWLWCFKTPSALFESRPCRVPPISQRHHRPPDQRSAAHVAAGPNAMTGRLLQGLSQPNPPSVVTRLARHPDDDGILNTTGWSFGAVTPPLSSSAGWISVSSSNADHGFSRQRQPSHRTSNSRAASSKSLWAIARRTACSPPHPQSPRVPRGSVVRRQVMKIIRGQARRVGAASSATRRSRTRAKLHSHGRRFRSALPSQSRPWSAWPKSR